VTSGGDDALTSARRRCRKGRSGRAPPRARRVRPVGWLLHDIGNEDCSDQGDWGRACPSEVLVNGRSPVGDLLIAVNLDPDSRLPYLLRVPLAGGMVFRISGTWPRTRPNTSDLNR
jgi:hypothetical protein